MSKFEQKIGIIIPARYNSTRLPGKPLIDLCGKSMIQRTWERCISALPNKQVFVATDSELIATHVVGFGGQVVMTSEGCMTGTDRLAEANEYLDLDLIINVQGDEPIINPADIKKVISFAMDRPGLVVNAIAKIQDEAEFYSHMIPKVTMSLDGRLLYMSRAPIPGNKDGKFICAYKQICIYAFPKKSLKIFSENSRKSPFELIEDIEILRFIENGMPVQLVEVVGDSKAVDVISDVESVISIIKKH